MKGKRIVVTRAPHQATELAELLCRHGAEPLLYPCIAIAPPENACLLDSAVEAIINGHFDWLVLTSANAVLGLAQQLETRSLSSAKLTNLLVAAIGPATAEAARTLLDLNVTVVPDEYIAEALVTVLRSAMPAHILVLQADIARPILIQELSITGATVTSIVAYRTVQGSGGVNLGELLGSNQVDAITFTSSSTVRNCLRRLEAEGGSPNLLFRVCLACIGPATARTAQELGFSVAVMPKEYTMEGLVAQLEEYFQDQHN